MVKSCVFFAVRTELLNIFRRASVHKLCFIRNINWSVSWFVVVLILILLLSFGLWLGLVASGSARFHPRYILHRMLDALHSHSGREGEEWIPNFLLGLWTPSVKSRFNCSVSGIMNHSFKVLRNRQISHWYGGVIRFVQDNEEVFCVVLL
jgi:hypothetical protein